MPIRWIALTFCSALSLLSGCGVDAAAPKPADSETSSKSDEGNFTETATLAGGCFWCTEAVFEIIQGVTEVESGYIGGRVANPTYKQVCTGNTGHAEAIRFRFDPDQITFEEILEIFFKTHDPTTLNQQGNDRGTQYRSAIFFHNDEQKAAAKKYITKSKNDFRSPIVTTLEETTTWYPAEEYHQDYFAKNPYDAYCQATAAKKQRKTRNLFKDKLKLTR